MPDDYPVHRKKGELLAMFRFYARTRDEEEFKEFLTETLGIPQGTERYAAALSAFWNLVRTIERELRR